MTFDNEEAVLEPVSLPTGCKHHTRCLLPGKLCHFDSVRTSMRATGTLQPSWTLGCSRQSPWTFLSFLASRQQTSSSQSNIRRRLLCFQITTNNSLQPSAGKKRTDWHRNASDRGRRCDRSSIIMQEYHAAIMFVPSPWHTCFGRAVNRRPSCLRRSGHPLQKLNWLKQLLSYTI